MSLRLRGFQAELINAMTFMIPTMRALSANLGFPLAERYTRRHIWGKKAQLDAWKIESADEKNRRIHASLCDVVEYAEKHVPYYRNLFKRIRFEPAKLRGDIRYKEDIPFLTKEIILAHPGQFLSDEFPPSELIERKSSGSTGLTLSFYYSKDDLDWTSAVLFHLNEAVSRSLSDREVHLIYVNPNAQPVGAFEGMRERLKLMAVNRANIKIRDLSAATVQSHLLAIRAQRPYLLYGLPSSLKALVQFAQDASKYRGLCENFVSSGETLDARSAQFIHEAIGCKVINRYGNAEFGAVAQSANDPQMLRIVDGVVFPEYFVIQGYSEIVLTTLVGRAMPLIRYRTGDLGTIEHLQDGSQVLSGIHGRLHDLVAFGGRTLTTSFIAACLHSKFRIHDFQIVQRDEQLPEFRIVTDYPEQLPEIGKELAVIVGMPVKVSRVRPTDLIRKGRQMKFAHYVRELGGESVVVL